MKKIYPVYWLVFLLHFTCLVASAQGHFSVSLIRPWTNYNLSTPDRGWGINLDVLSGKCKLGKSTSPLQARFGVNCYLSGMGHTLVKDIPLLPPLVGSAKVKLYNQFAGMNAEMRFTDERPGGKITPYFDINAGLRSFSSNMIVISDNYSQSDSLLKRVSGFNFGLAGGVMWKVSDMLNLDAGFMWSHTLMHGDLVNLYSAHKSGISLEYCTRPAPYELLMIKIGIVMLFDPADGSSSSSHESYHYRGGCHHSSGHSGGGGHVSVHSCSH